ncbi:protein of unknown function [Candidatus Filomicrobium marinum]|uniref:Uncharacterized protein n=1 Tax=Candidatus Filomicrobium marinum TaxID=1608628 RepID=A0A0D6JIG8_9HYPH|nr:protein of unknown function [Candidatus Filomicrobium marinum]
MIPTYTLTEQRCRNDTSIVKDEAVSRPQKTGQVAEHTVGGRLARLHNQQPGRVARRQRSEGYEVFG